MKLLVVQPHHDDAVWSIAEHMLTWIEDGHEVVVMTTHAGRVRLVDKERHRKHDRLDLEHHEAMVALGVNHWIQLDFPDDGWGAVHSPKPNEVSREIERYVVQTEPDVLVAPTGIHHPDHETCWLAVMNATISRRITVWFYDELPYYVLYPQLAFTTGRYDPAGHREHFEKKKELCQMYKSQWAPHLERTVYAPERVWRGG